MADCHDRKMPGEPSFTLLGRDPDFYRLVYEWANRRQQDINCGLRPQEDQELVAEAVNLACTGAEWRRNNDGSWRK